ncbi:hypothetical protein [Kitasatospora sp. NBC_01300]|uniref:hypothetical protein n=1 Tax=Kitasatospora sp. NBC_01300 TaxID=2903574 RepID=UPI00352F3D31|nr:hypothetical protein OG556_26265 [Kitasatospora sp. NBC_01300]
MTHFRAPRALAAIALAGSGLLAAAPALAATPATAAGVPSAPSAADVTAAAAAAKAAPVVQTLGGFFAHGSGQGSSDARQAQAAAPARVVGDTVPVYYLNPDFVAAASAGAPVAKFAFMATEADAGDGRKASVWTAPDPHNSGSWAEINIASGSDETDHAAAAAALGRGAVAFEEPQIRAWYALVDGQVRPLNPDAVRSVGDAGITLAQYQQVVHDRYADKLPGTDYAKAHLLGGFDRGTAPVAAPAGDSTPTTALLTGAGTLLAALGLGTALLRRRRAGRGTA